VDAAALEPHASASPRDSWVEEIASDALVAELVPKLPAPPRRPQALAARAEPGVPQPVVEGAGARGGIGGELGRRLQAAGAQTGDVQVSMRWDGVNDIDLHVTVEPFGGGGRSVISWQQKFGACGGVRYTIAIHHYMPWSRLPRTPVEVAVLVDGKVTRFQVVATSGEPARVVTSFIRHPAGVADQLAAANPND